MSAKIHTALPEDRPLELDGRIYQSRLLVSTEKYRNLMKAGRAQYFGRDFPGPLHYFAKHHLLPYRQRHDAYLLPGAGTAGRP